MTLRDIAIAIGFEVDQKTVDSAEAQINSVKNLAQKALGMLGIGLSIKGITNLVEAAAEVDALKSQFTQVFGEAEQAASDSLEKIANDTGVAAGRIKSSFVQIGAFAKTTGMEETEALEIAEKAMVAVADSAAFYDRSIEQVTMSMQSFLKGNYANDAALGLSCTEYTRNQAAMALYNKEFSNLSENEKQHTLLKMVEDANASSGALGQAARETDQWTNQLGNLKQRVKDLKVALGNGFLQPAIQVVKLMQTGLGKATEQVEKITKEGGFLEKEWTRIRNLFKVFQPIAERMTKALRDGADKAAEKAGKIIERLGGIDNVLRVVTMAVGAFVAIFAFDKIRSGLKMVSNLLALLKLPIVPVIAAVTALGLIIEDLVNFMAGNDSAIGLIFENAGIGADAAREKVKAAFAKIEEVVTNVWGTVTSFLSEHSEEIRQMFSTIWDAITQILSAAFGLVSMIAKSVFSALQLFWEEWGDKIKTVFSIFADFIGRRFERIVSIITQAAEVISAIFAGDISGALQSLLGIFQTIFEQILDTVKTIFTAIWTVVGERVESIRTTIEDGINKAVEFITGLPEKAVQWGADIIDGLKQGITDRISSIKDAVGGIAENITSFIHFSEPDEGPLKDFHKWMPDFVNGLATDLRNSQGPLIEQTRAMAQTLATITQAAVASVNTISAGAMMGRTSSVTQNVNINNAFNGGTAEIQRTTAMAAKKSATDATTQMARGLAYARG